jgi:hypothetical protein
MLAGAGDRKALFIEQFLYPQDIFYIALAIKALPLARFLGRKIRKLRLPEAQHVGWQMAQFRDFPDAEVETIGDDDVRGADVLGRREFGFSGSHEKNEAICAPLYNRNLVTDEELSLNPEPWLVRAPFWTAVSSYCHSERSEESLGIPRKVALSFRTASAVRNRIYFSIPRFPDYPMNWCAFWPISNI